MRKLICLIAVVLMVFVGIMPASADPGNGNGQCASDAVSVQDGTLLDPTGELITSGSNIQGYNYGAHAFDGTLCGFSYIEDDECQDIGIDLTARWNDAWLSSRDCDDDGELDRHWDWPSYRNSGAHITYESSYGDDWKYEAKVVAVPRASFLVRGIWYDHDGKEIGLDQGDFLALSSERVWTTGDGWIVLYKADAPGKGNHKNRPL